MQKHQDTDNMREVSREAKNVHCHGGSVWQHHRLRAMAVAQKIARNLVLTTRIFLTHSSSCTPPQSHTIGFGRSSSEGNVWYRGNATYHG
eukprot:scaffold6439_cov167-Amphora_coffeaeformis.AAC.9